MPRSKCVRYWYWLAFSPLMIQGLSACATSGTISRQTSASRIVGLDDDRFSLQNVRQGVWTPDTFQNRSLDGIYFIESRGDRRVPVLFIHGIYGSPRDFRFLIERLDRRRFQPCVYFHASGARLHDVASRGRCRMARPCEREYLSGVVVHGWIASIKKAAGGFTTHARILDDEAFAQRLNHILSSCGGVHRLSSRQH